jgi:NAD+ synthase (glutamine-hydrolysing)
MKDGLIRVGAGSPRGTVASPTACKTAAVAAAKAAAARGVRVLALPELCLTAYTCGDLLLSSLLLREAESALSAYIAETAALDMLSFIGLPVAHGGRIYNCLAAVCRGRLLGLVPKTHLPTYGGCYEARWFAPAPKENLTVCLCGETVLLGTRQLFCCTEMPALTVAAEICEDMWVAVPPSCAHAAAGATLIVNASAADENAGREGVRRAVVKSLSARLHAAYLYADAGEGESGTDMIYAGHCLVADGGRVVAERLPFAPDGALAVGECDLDRLLCARQRTSTFTPCEEGYARIPFSLTVEETAFSRAPSQNPFLPRDRKAAAHALSRALEIQSVGLGGRMQRAHAKTLVIGISGGLDSTLALLVATRAVDRLGLTRDVIHAVTMPGFGTTTRTRSNADLLCAALGVRLSCIPIGKAVEQHFADIGHDPAVKNAVYENAQARERTQILMDLANAENGLVVGTGDLSELALGWATYNGDHMSMYGVNASVPKTMVRALVSFVADEYFVAGDGHVTKILQDIVDTPVSPELLPPDGEEIAQKTEDLVGPYELHDFFLYHLLHDGFAPRKLFRYATAAFTGRFDERTVAAWLRVFLSRFFTQQFKRSCLPDGPRVTTVDLSPRGGWRMPSDASAEAWLAEIDQVMKERGLS